MMRALAFAIATALGAGFVPRAPGTCGTAVAVLLFWPLAGLPWWAYSLALAAITLIGIWAASEVGRASGKEDDQRIVIDEVAGYLVTMAGSAFHWPEAVAGFVLFRLFDIWKPPPVRWADERVPGSLGVMLDDLLAGIYALAALTALRLVLSRFGLMDPV